MSGRGSGSFVAAGSFTLPSPPGSSSGYVRRTRRHTDSDGSNHTMPRPKSTSNLLSSDRRYQLRDFDDTFMTDSLQDRHRRDDIAALIDFLRNHAPPADNFMSVPYSEKDEYGRGRWPLKVRRASNKRSKSVPRSPRPLRLPDSAVSGTTIGGHRHIAISIPLEASPFAEAAGLQHPAHRPDTACDSRPNSGRSTPIRTFTNDKGVVTVLRTVVEDGEGSSLRKPSGFHYRTQSSNAQRTPRSASRHLNSHSASSRSGMMGKQSDFVGISPVDADSSGLVGPRHSRSSSAELQNDFNFGTSSKSFQRAGYPVRASSMVQSRPPRQPASIDGMISGPSQHQSMLLSPPQTAFPLSAAGNYRRSIADSIVSVGEEPMISEAQTAVPVKSTSIIINGNQPWNEIKERFLPMPLAKPNHVGIPFPDSPLLPPNFDNSPPAPTSVNRSRREIVRDRKKRDMDAVKRRQQLDKTGEEEAGQDERWDLSEKGKLPDTGAACTASSAFEANGVTAPDGWTQEQPSKVTAKRHSKDSVRTFRDSALEMASGQTSTSTGPSLAPIMIVVDLEPQPSGAEAHQDADRAVPNVSAESQASAPAVTDAPGNPTPPLSVNGSPPLPERDSIDRTSLLRRREWNANREQERREREASVAAKARSKLLASAEQSSEPLMVPDADRDILRLYEAYRDHRFREMERRVRRLERNGDVWLRALVPVLDNVNRTMATVHDEHDALPSWIPEEKIAGPADRRSKSAMGRPPRAERLSSRRSSLSQGRILDQLARRADEAEQWDGGSGGSWSGSDDASGLGTIEPLMRELAGEAIQRQRAAAQRLGVHADRRRGRQMM